MNLNTLLKHTSRSLYLSVKMLPRSIRSAFGMAYLLCRYADTIADTQLLAPDKRLYWIEQFPTIVRTQDAAQEKHLVQALTGTSENPYEKELISHLADCLTALNQIEKSQKQFIYDVVQAVCDGMKIDLATFSRGTTAAPAVFKRVEDLTHYCRLMGGKPGLFWSQLIFHSHPVKLPQEKFYELGQHIGDALQIVNVLRDLPKDLSSGRCYFPQEQLATQSLSAVELLNKNNSLRFEPVKQYWLNWGKKNLQHAVAYFRAIPKTAWRTRAAVAWPVLWTADTFYKLANCTDLLDVSKRVKISRSRIYLTMCVTPFLLISNRIFAGWLTHKLNKLA